MHPAEKINKEKLIPALFDSFPISEEFRKLLPLSFKLGGMGIMDPTEIANDEYNSRELTSQLTNSIKQQVHRYIVSDENIKNCKSSIKKKRMDKHLIILTSLREQMPNKNKTLTILPKNKEVKAGLMY